MGIYSEFVQLRSDLLLSNPGESVPETWLADGLRVPRRRTLSGRQVPGRILVAATAVAAVLILPLGVRQWQNHRDRQTLARELRADAQGSLLYSEDLLPIARGVRGSARSEDARRLVAELAGRYERGRRSDDDVFWLVAGFLAQNDLNNADAYLRESLSRSPADHRLHTLAGILAYKRNDLASAGTHLERAVDLQRSAGNLLNLAIVRRAEGQAVEARRLTAEALELSPGPEFSVLAEQIARATETN
jgi:tetratricopeptide (TPR) repeat protein